MKVTVLLVEPKSGEYALVWRPRLSYVNAEAVVETRLSVRVLTVPSGSYVQPVCWVPLRLSVEGRPRPS